MDQADRIALWRNDEWCGDSMACTNQGQGRVPFTITHARILRHRFRSDRLAFPEECERNHAKTFRWNINGLYLDNAKAKETHTTQYFEMFGNRGIYHDGWSRVRALHSVLIVSNPPLANDVWELYNMTEDFSQPMTRSQEPGETQRTSESFMKEAAKNHASRSTTVGRNALNPVIAGDPT